MNTLRIAFGAVVWIAAAGFGAWLLWGGAAGAPPCDLGAWVRESPAAARALGAAVLAVAALWPVSLLLRDARERHLSFRNPGGEVRISLAAIRDFLARLSAEFPGVVSLRATVDARGSTLSVNMEARVRAGVEIPALTQRIQERVRESVRACLGIAEVGEVRVTVREFLGPVPPSDAIVKAPRASEGSAGFAEPPQGEESPAP